VAAILIVLTAVSLPTMEAMWGDTRVRGAGDEVRRAWAEARARAINTGAPYRFSVSGESRYKVAPDQSEFWDGSASESQETDDGKTLVGALPQSIRFAAPDTPDTGGGWHTVTVFLPDGTCRNDATVRIDADGQAPLFVSVRALTGIVSVRTQQREAGQ
jgi:Tfp pilus assembly protein FimT